MTASFDLPRRKGAALARVLDMPARTLQVQLQGVAPMAPETFLALVDHHRLDDHRAMAWLRQLVERRRGHIHAREDRCVAGEPADLDGGAA